MRDLWGRIVIGLSAGAILIWITGSADHILGREIVGILAAIGAYVLIAKLVTAAAAGVAEAVALNMAEHQKQIIDAVKSEIESHRANIHNARDAAEGVMEQRQEEMDRRVLEVLRSVASREPAAR